VKLIQPILLAFKLMAWTSHASLTFSMTAYIWQKNAPGLELVSKELNHFGVIADLFR
jgi:hypothetical protein